VNNVNGTSSTGALAIHAVLLPPTTSAVNPTASANKILLFDRGEFNTETKMWVNFCRLNDKIFYNCSRISSLFDYQSGTYKPQTTYSNPFCGAQGLLANGTALIIGGTGLRREANSTPQEDGRNAIRTYDPLKGWTTLATKLPAAYW
jgi:hypothetical protein